MQEWKRLWNYSILLISINLPRSTLLPSLQSNHNSYNYLFTSFSSVFLLNFFPFSDGQIGYRPFKGHGPSFLF